MSFGAVAAEQAALTTTPAQSAGALADLYGRLAPSIRRLCLGYMRDADDAEDLTQEAFVRLATRIDELDGDVPAYAYRIARNLCCDELARRRRREHLAQQAIDAPRDESDAVVARSESRDLLERVRRSLTADEFALFVQIASGHSQAEVAERMQITETNVSVRLCRARQKVRALFGGASAVAALTLWRRLRGAARTAPGRGGVAAAPAAVLSAAVIGALTIGSLALQPWNSHLAPPSRPPSGVALHADAATGARLTAPTGSTATLTVTSGAHAVPSAAPASASSLAQSLLDPGRTATPQQTGITSIAVSPDYSNDHTILAAGGLAVGCGNPVACNVLFRSSDGGRTWSHLAGSGFAGGTLLLPPAFATDRVVYAMGTLGLEVSRDGGLSFTLAVPGEVAAAIAPSSTPATTDIVLGTSPLTVYHSGSGLTTPGPQLPLGTLPPDALAYEPSTGTLLATADIEDAATGVQDGEVLRCAAAAPCAVVATAAQSPGLQLATGSDGSTGDVAAAYTGRTLLTTWDDGRDFSRTTGAAGSLWRSATITHAGSLVAISQTSDGAETPRAFSAAGAANPLSASLTEGVAAGSLFMTTVSLPDGRLLAGLVPGSERDVFGLLCSADGRVWAAAC